MVKAIIIGILVVVFLCSVYMAVYVLKNEDKED